MVNEQINNIGKITFQSMGESVEEIASFKNTPKYQLNHLQENMFISGQNMIFHSCIISIIIDSLLGILITKPPQFGGENN